MYILIIEIDAEEDVPRFERYGRTETRRDPWRNAAVC